MTGPRPSGARFIMDYKDVEQMAISRNHFHGQAARMWKLAFVLAFTSAAAAEPRDGSHDFDFQLGKWQLKIRKLEHPLSGEQKWLDYAGTGTVRPLWNGKAQVEEL